VIVAVFLIPAGSLRVLGKVGVLAGLRRALSARFQRLSVNIDLMNVSTATTGRECTTETHGRASRCDIAD
jgi:hypothetical protein